MRQIRVEVAVREKPKMERARGVEKKGERRVEVVMGMVAYLAIGGTRQEGREGKGGELERTGEGERRGIERTDRL